MPTPLKVPFGEQAGRLVHVDTVASGLACGCVCPGCGARLVARHGEHQRHHFAHHRQTACDGESLLHLLGKRLLAERIAREADAEAMLPISWSCPRCADVHRGNLLRRACSVRVEESLGGIRPDLSLYGPQGELVAMVEIVVSHAPEPAVRGHCLDRNLPLVEIRLGGPADLELLATAAELPVTLDLCTRPKCRGCGEPLQEKRMHVGTTVCWRCEAPMLAALVGVEDGHYYGPDAFTRAEAEQARRLGTSLSLRRSGMSNEPYLACTCRKCGAFLGAGHLQSHLHILHENNGVPIGTHCHHCDDREF